MSRKKYAVVGLTGTTGSGKSSIARVFAENGCYVIDADSVAREAVKKGSLCLKQLRLTFGEDILDENGELNRRELARRAFSSREGTQLLNDITHPAIIMLTMIKIKELVQKGESIIVFDAPTLFESNSDVMCDYIIAVTAPWNLRLKRIMARDGITEEQAITRMGAQQDDGFYTEQSDFVIINDGEPEQVREQAERIIGFIKCESGIELIGKSDE